MLRNVLRNVFGSRAVATAATAITYGVVAALLVPSIKTSPSGAAVGFAITFLSLENLSANGLWRRSHDVARLLTLGRFACAILGHDPRAGGTPAEDYCQTCGAVVPGYAPRPSWPPNPYDRRNHGGD